MIKRALLIFFLAQITACTSQVNRHNIVRFENICASTLEIHTENRSNFDLAPYTTLLHPGRSAVVATYMAYTESIDAQVQENYILEITSQHKKTVIGKDQLLALISEITPQEKNNSRVWIFTDASLCAP
jgi:hypothetical protein